MSHAGSYGVHPESPSGRSQQPPLRTPSGSRPPPSTWPGKPQLSTFNHYSPHQHQHQHRYPDLYNPDLNPYLDLSLPTSTACPPVDFDLDPSFYSDLPDPLTYHQNHYYPDLTTTTTSTNPFDFDPNNTLGLFPDLVSDSTTLNSLLSSPDELSDSYLFESPSVPSLPDPQVKTPPSLPESSQMPAVTTTDTHTTNPAFTVSISRVATPKEPPNKVSKRQLNTLAARRYRQRKLDRVNELEAELEAIKRERDELRMRVSKLEGETEALRGLVKGQGDKA
ncbi:bZIP transcription factor [Aspergillus homomorphus CBS 101889]|uniref:BZIP domain-containing protein n=1 Tax=Aspergillus homomorphus (strain CBS 101889) TaxID=1450537 RepID=A0A395HQJ7_ASPHC|nr:hypothetical protein BO97DRAFT_445272 [Aspergillus homomorphus CBS 101889]RAL09769.1 hypothetical protein BO97DRAFT_445272 [Aspergillus homomorphus CBS 101889]